MKAPPFKYSAGKEFYMANGAKSLGLCAPISVIQGRCQVVLGKKKGKRNGNKIKIAVSSRLHFLLPNKKASINADGTLLEQNYISYGCNGRNVVPEKTHKITVQLRCRYNTVDFSDPQKQIRQSSRVWERCGMSFFLLELCFPSSLVTTLLFVLLNQLVIPYCSVFFYLHI